MVDNYLIRNRSDSTVTYKLPELNNTRRVFGLNETKPIPKEELTALYQTDGGRTLLEDYLVVQNEEWVAQFLPDAPIEYFWTHEDVENCVKNESVELFEDTIRFAPAGVVDLIKLASWQLPLTDLNKVDVMKNLLGFDPIMAAEIMKNDLTPESTGKKERLRRREA